MTIKIAVIGCGLGGVAMASMLQKAGYDIEVFEQAPAFLRIGAGIHLTPNLMRALTHIDLANEIISAASLPDTFTSRDAHSNHIIAELRLQSDIPYLTIHRGDFHSIMVRSLSPGTVNYGKRLKCLSEQENHVHLTFEDGSETIADIVIGADGLSSVVRNTVCNTTPPVFASQVAYRAQVNLADVSAFTPPEALTKWWSDDRFVIGYYLNNKSDKYYFVAGMPAVSWEPGVQFRETTTEQMLEGFADFHPSVKNLLSVATRVTEWPLFERPADRVWSRGRVVLLGDACHPMRPHMAQGAAMAIEDAAVLVRCIQSAGSTEWEGVFLNYQKTREARVARVQSISHENSWMRSLEDPEWLFSYDAWNTPLTA